jgi:hypothetical protein
MASRLAARVPDGRAWHEEEADEEPQKEGDQQKQQQQQQQQQQKKKFFRWNAFEAESVGERGWSATLSAERGCDALFVEVERPPSQHCNELHVVLGDVGTWRTDQLLGFLDNGRLYGAYEEPLHLRSTAKAKKAKRGRRRGGGEEGLCVARWDRSGDSAGLQLQWAEGFLQAVAVFVNGQRVHTHVVSDRDIRGPVRLNVRVHPNGMLRSIASPTSLENTTIAASGAANDDG